MSTTIDQLEIEVQSSAKSAETGIDALASSLGRLKNAVKGGVGLTAVTNQITKLNTALSSVNSANTENLNKLVSALTPLSTIGKSNLNSFISQLQRLPEAVKALDGVNTGNLGDQITKLTSALTPLTNIGKNNLTSFVTQLQKLPQVMTALDSVDMGKLATQMQQLASALSPLAKEMQSIANGFSAFPARIQRLVTSMNTIPSANKKAGASFANLGVKLGISVYAIKRVANAVAGWISKSNEYVEDLNLFTVALGQYATEAKNYAESVSEIMGIDPADWLRNQGIFMTLASGFGVVSDRAYTMSQNLTQLGYDLSSFFNISYEDAFLKIQSGLSGELEPLRRLGYDLSVARLQQEAYTLGIEKKVTAMTQAEKAELRYYAIMTQVTTAQGDMARTLSAPANQLRVLQAQVTQCARSLGNIFIPILNAVLPYAIALARAIRLVADTIANLFGFTLPEVDFSGISTAAGDASDLSDNVGDVGGGLDDAASKAKELKNALLGIDELNVITQTDTTGGSGGSSGGVSAGGGLGFELPTYDFLGDAVNNKIQGIVDKLKDWLGLTGEINSWSDFLHTRLGTILTLVGYVGVGLAAWKITTSTIDAINAIKTLLASPTYSIAIGLILTLEGFTIEFKALKDAVLNGLDGFNFVEIVAGALLGTGGVSLLGSKLVTWIGKAFSNPKVAFTLARIGMNLGVSTTGAVGAALGAGFAAIIAGVPAFFVGIYDSLKNEIDLLSASLTAAGSTAAGAGIGTIIGALGGPIGAGIGALIGLAVGLVTDGVILVVQKWGAISEWWNSTVIPFFGNVSTKIQEFLDGVKNWFVEKWNATIEYLKGIPTKIGLVIDAVQQWFSELPGKIGYALGFALGTVVKWVTETYEKLRDEIPKTIDAVKTWFSELPGKIKTAISTTITKVSEWASDVKNQFEVKVTSIITSITTWFSELPTKIKTAIDDTKKKLTAWATEMKEKIKVEIPKIINNFVNFFKEIPDKLKTLGSDIWQGLINGLKNSWYKVKNAVSDFSSEFIEGFKDALGIHSPSRVFLQLAQYTIEGFNIGLKNMMPQSFSVMDTWAEGITSYQPTVGFSVDTSALKYYNGDSFAKSVSANVMTHSSFEVDSTVVREEFKAAMLEALNDSKLAEDMRRQADKPEQTVVQIGNREVSDAVTTQRRANGYAFAR